MGFFEPDAEEMLEVYLLEVRQLNGQLGKVLLEAEKDGSLKNGDIHNIFRIMHTIKSSSAMMGLQGLSSLAHKLEDLFAYYRDTPVNMGRVQTELFDLLFAVSDFLDKELEEMAGEGYTPSDTSSLEQQASDYLARISREPLTGQPCEAVREAEGHPKEPEIPARFLSGNGTVVRVILEKGCRMENVRAYMLVRSIMGMCSYVDTFPQNLQKSADSAGYISENGVFIRFESKDSSKVIDMLKKGLFVEQCVVVREEKEKEETDIKPKTSDSLLEIKESEFMEVRTKRLDSLQNLAAELIIQMQTLENRLDELGIMDLKEGTAHQMSLLIGETERTVMEMRMVPVERIVPKLRRILRDICRDQEKEAELVVSCGSMEADKSIVEYVSEALMHILRNAVDHGIETPGERLAAGKPRKGRISFVVESLIGELLLTIKDDGCGLDVDKIREKAREKGLFTKPEEEYDEQELRELILSPGFTTNDQVTEYSGRGVGLDVVKNVLEDVGGNLYISSEKGKGSAFTVSVPLTLSTMECILFFAGECCFALPVRHVFRFLEYARNHEKIRCMDGKEYIVYEDRMIPLINLRSLYDLTGQISEEAVLIYVKGAEREGCLIMDSMYDQRRIVIKTLPALFGGSFRRRTGVSGFSILGDGTICSVLDTEILISRYLKGGAKQDGRS